LRGINDVVPKANIIFSTCPRRLDEPFRNQASHQVFLAQASVREKPTERLAVHFLTRQSKRLKAMKLSSTWTGLTSVALFCVTVTIGPADISHAQNSDYVSCVAEQYDRVRTEGEIAETIRACTRALASVVSAEQRARAYYFRGLNHFLDSVRLAIAEMKPIGSAGDPAQSQLKSALDDLGACIAAAPEPSAFPFSLRATIYTALERYDNALADLEQAIRADPKTSSHFVQRAVIWERLDRFPEARADLDSALTLNPGNQNAWINRARLWTRYGDIDRAFSDYNQAETVGGTQTWDALSGRAKLAVRLGEPRKAFADWTRAAELSPLPTLAAQFHVRAGNLARDYLKEHDKAQLSYGRALELIPNYPDAFVQRGIAFERANRFDEALKDYGKAVEIGSSNPLQRAEYDYSSYRLEVLRSRLSRKAGDPSLPPNINVLSRSAGSIAGDRGRRVALVLGNAAYAHVSSLMNADRDAESVGFALSEAGFAKVTVATNLDREQLETVLHQFADEAAGADWAVIYYAGHGIEVQGVNYIIPIDASFDTLQNAPSRAVSIAEIISAARPAKALRLIALDACRDDPFVQEAHRMASRGRDTGKPTGDIPLDSAIAHRKEIGGGLSGLQLAELNTVVLYSTQPGQVALDGDELNSPFTRAFVRNIPGPALDLRLFFERVSDDVANDTQRRQRPAVNGHLRQSDRFFFFPAQ
jgi:tetratricopeptide (TPR) repeat protein